MHQHSLHFITVPAAGNFPFCFYMLWVCLSQKTMMSQMAFLLTAHMLKLWFGFLSDFTHAMNFSTQLSLHIFYLSLWFQIKVQGFLLKELKREAVFQH